MVNVLIVEDEAILAMDLQRKLKRVGYHVPTVAQSAEDVLRIMQSFPPDLILMDIHIRGSKDGIDVAELIRKTSDLPIIFVTGQGDENTIHRARRTTDLPSWCYASAFDCDS